MRKYNKLVQEIEQLKSAFELLTKRVQKLECSHTKTHLDCIPDYYDIDSDTHEIKNYYGEICDYCGKLISGFYTEEEMLKIKIERDEKRLAEIKK